MVIRGETELSFRLIPSLAKITSSQTVLVRGFVWDCVKEGMSLKDNSVSPCRIYIQLEICTINPDRVVMAYCYFLHLVQRFSLEVEIFILTLITWKRKSLVIIYIFISVWRNILRNNLKVIFFFISINFC